MFWSHISAFSPPDVLSVLIYSFGAKAELHREGVSFPGALWAPGHTAWNTSPSYEPVQNRYKMFPLQAQLLCQKWEPTTCTATWCWALELFCLTPAHLFGSSKIELARWDCSCEKVSITVKKHCRAKLFALSARKDSSQVAVPSWTLTKNCISQISQQPKLKIWFMLHHKT